MMVTRNQWNPTAKTVLNRAEIKELKLTWAWYDSVARVNETEKHCESTTRETDVAGFEARSVQPGQITTPASGRGDRVRMAAIVGRSAQNPTNTGPRGGTRTQRRRGLGLLGSISHFWQLFGQRQ